MAKETVPEESLEALRKRTALANKFAWLVVSGITAMCFREKGEATLNEIWRRLLASEQKNRFLAALDKLEIKNNPPAVTAAFYHYFSNSIGGLNMQVVIEGPKKAWIRYMAPWGSYPGIAAFAVPPSVRRTILSTWHPRNGELLGCPRLGWVATKFVAEGHPYDEGYFFEYDRDLRPEERFRVEHVSRSPEFDPAAAPRLDPEKWPEARILKGGFNYSVDYVQHTVEIVYALLGAPAADHVIASAMRLMAAQFTADLATTTGEIKTDPIGIANLFKSIMASFKNTCEVAGDSKKATLTLSGLKPFPERQDEQLRGAIFEFFAMAARIRNGHVSITRRFDTTKASEVWTIADEGKWLW